jgi:predicted nucleotidyltransferase
MPTALELGPDGWKSYIESQGLRNSGQESAPQTGREKGQILSRVHHVAAALRSRFGVKKVILFGSIAHEAWFREDSDLDLAVEGLGAEDYWEAWAMVEDMIPERPVDFIDIESATDSMKRTISRHGVVL